MAIVKIKKTTGGFTFEKNGNLQSFIRKKIILSASPAGMSIVTSGIMMTVLPGDSLEVNDQPFAGTMVEAMDAVRDTVLNVGPVQTILANPFYLSASEIFK